MSSEGQRWARYFPEHNLPGPEVKESMSRILFKREEAREPGVPEAPKGEAGIEALVCAVAMLGG